jgi:hypothetical protein
LRVYEGLGVSSYPFDQYQYFDPRKFLGGFEYSTIEPCPVIPTKIQTFLPSFVPSRSPSIDSSLTPSYIPTIDGEQTTETLDTPLFFDPSPSIASSLTPSYIPTIGGGKTTEELDTPLFFDPSETKVNVDDTKYLMTQIEYVNHMVHPASESTDSVSKSVNESIQKTLNKVLSETTTELNILAYGYELRMKNITSFFSGVIRNDAQCIPIDTSSYCSQVTTLITFSHLNNLEQETVRHEVLKVAKEASYDLPYSAYYRGQEALTAKTILTLNGIEAEMNSNALEVFEDAVLSFLNSQLANNNIIVTGMKVFNQTFAERRMLINWKKGHDFNRAQFRSLQSSSSLDVITVVTGEHKPPPDINFDILVTDTINSNDIEIVESLKLKKPPAFQKIEKLSARPQVKISLASVSESDDIINQDEPPDTNKKEDAKGPNRNIWMIVGLCVGFLVIGLGIAGFIFMRGLKKVDEDIIKGNNNLLKSCELDNSQQQKRKSIIGISYNPWKSMLKSYSIEKEIQCRRDVNGEL